MNFYREGDADLYISQFLQHPSYNTSEYCLHSATCGIDRIDIPAGFKRPIGVAVYGHVLHPLSTFKLSVTQRHEIDPFDDSDLEYTDTSESVNDYTDIPKVLKHFITSLDLILIHCNFLERRTVSVFVNIVDIFGDITGGVSCLVGKSLLTKKKKKNVGL